jgi:glutamyl-tRNA synthetase
MVKTRFAPSPTGLLHIGNARTALICYLFAKQQDGEFMLRLDDTDTERSKESYVEAAYRDLQWLGLQWDQTARQSERMERYEAVKAELIAAGRLYPCYETPEEIEMKRKMLLGRGLPPIYDRSALSLTEEQKQAYEAEGRKAHWRFKLDQSQLIEWDDLIKGRVAFEASKLSDPVLIRENGSPTYMLPSAIDDMDFEITHVVRGEDHVSNTAIQIQLFEAIGASVPQFAHHSLMKAKDGKISKRDGGYDLETLRGDGIEPMAINSYLARLGTSDPIEPWLSADVLLEKFNLSRFSKAAAVYDRDALVKLNEKIVRQLPYDAVKELPEMQGIDEAFWVSVRPNLSAVKEIKDWWEICRNAVTPIIDEGNKGFLEEIAQLLPKEAWSEDTWQEWLAEVKANSNRKGKELFLPIRQALTARSDGPEMKQVFVLLGYERVQSRLLGKSA